MPKLRIAMAQVNATVGDLTGNADKIVEWTRRAERQGAQVIVFPEMMLTGYPVEDLALRGSFLNASRAAVREVAERLAADGLGGIAVVTGYLDRREGLAPRTGLPAGAPLDAAALLYGGEVVITTAKHHLPNYGVFDEYRYFVPGDSLPVFRMSADGGQVDVAIAICEDLWQDGGPVAVTRQAGASLLVVPNASPYERGKDDRREELCARCAGVAGAALAYANMIGGQDELVFDGGSILVDADGNLLARGPQFDEALIVTDLELPAAPEGLSHDGERVDAGDGTMITIRQVELASPASGQPGQSGDAAGGTRPAIEHEPLWPSLPDSEEVYNALVLGVRDYVRKNGFRTVILGLSGGIDSALTATIAADALGPDRVYTVLMPSRYSSDHSISDAEDLVRRQGIHSDTVPIKTMVDSFEAALSPAGFPDTGLPAENLQARVRGMILMGLSNAHGHLVLTTGNKSELAVGYSTLYGDSAGGFGPIKDVFKTLVWELSRWRNAQAEAQGQAPPIPENSITKPPSAELAPGQQDTDSLPDYELLDALLDDYVEQDLGSGDLIAKGYDADLVQRVIMLVDRAEYKRRQYPPGPKISPKNFGRDRRLPITNSWREPPPGQTKAPADSVPDEEPPTQLGAR
ncbi:MAG TPA: NAD+ synthase [Streptosporangiaceae bacterium]